MTAVKVWNFVKPSVTATLNSSFIATFVAETLGTEVYYDPRVNEGKLDVLIIINGPYAFCAHLPALAKAIRTAKRVVWCQNDYTVVPPKISLRAQSPFRAVWRARKRAGLPHIDFWSTLPPDSKYWGTSGPATTELSRYVNWNSMAYEPLDSNTLAKLRTKSKTDLFYFGAYRKGREVYFDRYFNACKCDGVPLTISGARPQWKQNWPHANVIGALARADFFKELAVHGLGLYVEDVKSHKIFTSPASRLYEMLAAGLPMVFQPECTPTLKQGGFDVGRYVLQDPSDIKRMMKHRFDIAEEQRKWRADYRGKLRKTIRSAYEDVEAAL